MESFASSGQRPLHRKGAARAYVSTVALLFLLLSPQHLCAQTEARALPRFRVRLTSGDRMEGRGGILTDSTLVGRTAAGASLNVRTADIRVLDVRAGSQAGRGALIGAGMGLVVSVLAIAQVAADPDSYTEKETAVKATVGLTLGGGIVGALVGLKGSRWQRIPLTRAVGVDARGSR
jgi:hypothetical protein